MGPVQVILMLVTLIVFVVVIIKLWTQPGDTSLTVPDVIAEKITPSAGTACNVTGVTGLVDMNGENVFDTTVPCKDCESGYMSLQKTGLCNYLEYNETEKRCQVAPGEPDTCPFNEKEY
jgi:hypothetical protein